MPKLSLAKLERHLYAAADRLRQEGFDAVTYNDYTRRPQNLLERIMEWRLNVDTQGHSPRNSALRVITRICRKYQEFLSKLIVQGKKEKVLKKEVDENLTALVMIAFRVEILLQWSMNKDDIDGKAHANTFKKIMLQGLIA